ncbi:VWA domain-containing protein [Actinoplanes sp. NPDC048967]|uniref:vWA domain-containing protein n=1 Tax=Actinoplanes sp. NPDC048967 TaxID=3155269 RepID=UPI0033EE6C7C
MSSCTRTRPDRRRTRAAALLLAVGTLLAVSPAAAAAPVPLPITAVLVDGAQTSLVVDLSASTRPAAVAVTHDGRPQQATVEPVVADGLAVTLVVDTSADGATALPAWLSAAARFILEAPGTTRAAVIAGSAPASVTAGGERGRAGVIRALTSLRPRGERDTAAALSLAERQFPTAETGRRVVVLYTTAADAVGERADVLAGRFRASGTILVVVGTAAGGSYWASAAAGTGGFFAPAGDPVVMPALDQVTTTLRGRHLIRFPTPASLPATVSVRVDAGDLELAGDAVVPAPVARPPAGDRPWTAVVPGLVAIGLTVAIVAMLWWRRRRSGPASSTAQDRRSHPGPQRARHPAAPSAVTGQPHSGPPPARQPAAPSAVTGQPHSGPPPARQPAAPGPDVTAAGEPTAVHHLPAPSSGVVRGRARVPGAVARGRAKVPPGSRAEEQDRS